MPITKLQIQHSRLLVSSIGACYTALVCELCRSISDIIVSRGSAAKHIRFDGICNKNF